MITTWSPRIRQNWLLCLTDLSRVDPVFLMSDCFCGKEQNFMCFLFRIGSEDCCIIPTSNRNQPLMPFLIFVASAVNHLKKFNFLGYVSYTSSYHFIQFRRISFAFQLSWYWDWD